MKHSPLFPLRHGVRCFGGLLAALLLLQPWQGFAQGTLSNGGRHPGELLAAGEVDSWNFTATAPGPVMLRVGATTFTPTIRLFDPGNAQIGETTSGNTFVRDGLLSVQLPTAGVYTVLVSATFGNQTGAYDISMGLVPGEITVSAGDEGGAITNGAVTSASLALGDLDVWSFSANAGDGLMLRMGSESLTPWIRLYGPDGALAGETTSGNSFARDGSVSAQATNAGVYTVIASATFAGQSGPYRLHLAKSPGTFTVSPGDQGGEISNGGAYPGSLDVGDLDMWSFTANAGDNLMLRMGAQEATPWIRLYAPNGALVGEQISGNAFARDGVLLAHATNAGTYTVVVSATHPAQHSDYTLSFAKAPGAITVVSGDQGGDLLNGATTLGSLTVGDLDVWSFSAAAGEGLMIRMGAPSLTPWLRLYDPTGSLVAEQVSGNAFARDGALTATATNAGVYTLVVSATHPSQSGDYRLHLAKTATEFVVSDGDQGGELQSGSANPGVLTVGDLDLWSFEADAADGIMLRMGASSLTPWLRLYDPTGTLVEEETSGNAFARDGHIQYRTTSSGRYTVVVSAAYAGQEGDYSLYLAQIPRDIVVPPGDQGGSLTNGFSHAATLTIGDLDVWSFIGTPGDSNVIRVAATNFTPWIILYGPDGTILRETTSGNAFARSGSVSLNITNAGVYTVVVSAAYAGQESAYGIKQSRVPPDLIVPESPVVDEGTVLNFTISAQDPDEPVKPLVFNVLSRPEAMSFAIAGPTNATLTWNTSELDGPSTNIIVATVTDRVGTKDFIRTNSFTIVIREINTPPQLTVPDDQTIEELSTLNVSASATDIDVPVNALTYTLLAAPEGMSINAQSGEISWQPTETQGPSTNTVTVVVTDDNPLASNERQLSATNSFTVVVREVNTPPALTVPGPQRITEASELSVTAAGSDQDLPANPLTFNLVAGPQGLLVDAATGLIRWTPSETQGGTTNLVSIAMSDDSPSAVNVVRFSVTNSFTVIVDEVNSPPVLTLPSDQVISETASLNVTATAVDPDVPSNALTYTLNGPTGMAINPATGAITWTPTEAQGPSTNVVTVVVTDNNPGAAGNTQLSVTNIFTVTVTEENSVPTLEPIQDQSVHFDVPLTIAVTASDVDLPANKLVYTLESSPTGMQINETTGAITWTPGEGQVGSYSVTVKVQDDGTPPMNATRTFQVTVTGEGARLEIERAAAFVRIRASGDVGVQYELQGSADLLTWQKLTEFQMTGTPFAYIDPDSDSGEARFYRLLLIQE